MKGLPQPALAMMDAAMREKHRQRALRQIAQTLCSSTWSDGFCNGDREDCRCRAMAVRIVGALDLVGVTPVWEFDQALHEALAR